MAPKCPAYKYRRHFHVKSFLSKRSVKSRASALLKILCEPHLLGVPEDLLLVLLSFVDPLELLQLRNVHSRLCQFIDDNANELRKFGPTEEILFVFSRDKNFFPLTYFTGRRCENFPPRPRDFASQPCMSIFMNGYAFSAKSLPTADGRCYLFKPELKAKSREIRGVQLKKFLEVFGPHWIPHMMRTEISVHLLDSVLLFLPSPPHFEWFGHEKDYVESKMLKIVSRLKIQRLTLCTSECPSEAFFAHPAIRALEELNYEVPEPCETDQTLYPVTIKSFSPMEWRSLMLWEYSARASVQAVRSLFGEWARGERNIDEILVWFSNGHRSNYTKLFRGLPVKISFETAEDGTQLHAIKRNCDDAILRFPSFIYLNGDFDYVSSVAVP